MKYQLVLAIILASSSVALSYRIRKDFRQLSTEQSTPNAPDLDFVPALKGYDFSGKPVVLPPSVRRVALMPLHQIDDAVQTRLWKEFLASSGSGKGILVIGVFADGGSLAGLEGAPWFRSVAYANYAPLMIVTDLDRKNEIAILNNRGIVQKRIPRATEVRQLEAAFQ